MAGTERTDGKPKVETSLILRTFDALEKLDPFRWERVQRYVESADHGSAAVGGFQTVMLSGDGAYRVGLEKVEPEPPAQLRVLSPYRLVISRRGQPSNSTIPVMSEEGQRRAKVLYDKLADELGMGNFDGKKLIEDFETALESGQLR